MPLWIAVVILAISMTLHALLKATLLGRPNLVLRIILTLGWVWLLVGLLTILGLLVSLRLILVVIALVVLAPVVVIRSRHFDEVDQESKWYREFGDGLLKDNAVSLVDALL